jgi:hypothetical protein
MDKELDMSKLPDFSLDDLFFDNSKIWVEGAHHENGSTQGISPRERIQKSGIKSISSVKDSFNDVLQELINILNTVFKLQEEKLTSHSENLISNTNEVIIGEKGILDWVIMSKLVCNKVGLSRYSIRRPQNFSQA